MHHCSTFSMENVLGNLYDTVICKTVSKQHHYVEVCGPHHDVSSGAQMEVMVDINDLCRACVSAY